MDMKRPFIIGIAGGTASGKTSVCKKVIEELDLAENSSNRNAVVAVSQDSFYKDLSPHEKDLAKVGEYNFDHPDAFDEDLMKETMLKIASGKPVNLPIYDRINFKREREVIHIEPADVVIFEGILVLYDKDLRNIMHMKVFVDTDSDTRLSRRVLRDTKEKGRDLGIVLSHYTKYVKPAFEEFTLPTKKHADVILPRGADNKVGINLIIQHIKDIIISDNQLTSTRRRRQKSESGVRPH
ncbi:uncharacterized protein TRIADDRAFT_20888 [Trichoplax adhaerens]|uniref:Uridine kinase n=1 Tax=Trichoplax adhaerens TaxID=10228 RepID=B3RNF1_TRIAD|nr:hypothetical protein TRIADDRAFT_20888 [Trichoplax adhaerens]EDV27442.1 hypothetical protein TRIADDRAFT_20888 [Trichoplax adhaerens]|eukprot:XP_002109276.1 hypothetical protein TRIADDRAFT_20888 [Trichoplax adhaerens]